MPRSKKCIGSLITATKWLPVIVTGTIFTWGWYAFIFQLVIFSLSSLWKQILYLVIFHILFIFSFWSYIQTIFTPFTKIPSKFFLTPEVSEDLAKASSDEHRNAILAYVVKKNDLPVVCRTYQGGVRYCEKCNMIKPDRCHHCSICGICILRMDHHCPWINNCVSFTNYKFFVLFLGYTFALCVFVSATTFPYTLSFWNFEADAYRINNSTAGTHNATQDTPPNPLSNPVPFGVRFHILFLFFVSSMLSLGVMFLYCYHIHLLLHNQSTLESFRAPLMSYGPDKNAFNLGKKENFLQLFGRSRLLWFIPVFTTEGSGLTYDRRSNLGPQYEEARQELLNHLPVNNNTGFAPANKDTEV